MAMTENNCCRRLRQVAMAALLGLAITGLGRPLPTAAAAGWPGVAPPPAPGLARIWIYRDYEPYQTLARPYLRLNGTIAGISEPGGAFYRDVAPGTYQITVDSDGIDVNQFASVGVGAGQQVFVKVLASASWDSGGGGKRGSGAWRRDTFYTWLIEPQIAAAEIARLPLYGGG